MNWSWLRIFAMWKLTFLCVLLCVMSGDAVRRFRKRYASGAGSYAGGYAGGSVGGYTGGYAGDYGPGFGGFGTYTGAGFGYAPGFSFGFIDPYLFHQQLTAQILAQHAAQNNAIASSFTTGDASVTADASLLPDDERIQAQIAAEQAYYNTLRQHGLYNQKGFKANRYAPNYAVASGTYGNGGYTQTAYISPENPGVPNVVNRFSTSSSSGAPGGYHGISVSSFSSSSDIDGKKTGHRGAQTTINDNGKITTYQTHS